MKLSGVVCTLLFCCMVNSDAISVLDDKCRLMTVSDLNADSPDDATLAIPKDCTSGDVDWHYPKGNLLLSASLDVHRQYTFCIEESWATMIGGIIDVTTAGRHQTLPLPKKDMPTCVKSVDGKVQLLLKSEDTQYYMTTFKYSIKY